MKKIIASVLGIMLLASCGTARKVQQVKQESRIDSTAIAKEANAKVDKFVDTTRTQHDKVTITEIEFYPPFGVDDIAARPGKGNQVGSKSQKGDSLSNEEPAQKAGKSYAVGSIKGA